MKVSSQKALPGISSLISAANELIRASAQNENPVLITGEVGTEKSFAAKLVHQLGARANRPLVKLTVSWKLPSNISQYFSQCDGGTLIIQLQKDFPIDMQYTLVELASDGAFADPMTGDLVETDVRMILTSSLTLEELNGRTPLLPELREMLAEQHISIPPLRARTEDIPALVRYAMRRARETGKSKAENIDPQVLVLFRHWHWPGNTEDLLLVTAQAALTCKGEVLTAPDLPESFLKQLPKELVESSKALARIPSSSDAEPPGNENIDPDTAQLAAFPGTTAEARALSPLAAITPLGMMVNRDMPTPLAIRPRTPLPREDSNQEPSTQREAGAPDTRSTRVLQLARRLNAQSRILSRQMSGPLPTKSTEEIMDHLMKESTDDEALESLEQELDRGLELVMSMRRQLALLNLRQQQTQDTIRDLVQRISESGGTDEEAKQEIAEEARELTETLKAIDDIMEKVAQEMPRTGEHFEAVSQGNLPHRESLTSGIFKKPTKTDPPPGIEPGK